MVATGELELLGGLLVARKASLERGRSSYRVVGGRPQAEPTCRLRAGLHLKVRCMAIACGLATENKKGH